MYIRRTTEEDRDSFNTQTQKRPKETGIFQIYPTLYNYVQRFEMILIGNLRIYMILRNVLHIFRHGLSTSTQLLKQVDDLMFILNNNERTAIFFLDMDVYGI